MERYLKEVVSAPASCVSEKFYNALDDPAARHHYRCISITSQLFPRDIMQAQTPFAELVRWLLYGRRSPVVVPQDPGNLIPRITHYVRFEDDADERKEGKKLRFDRFLSVLSALYLGGFERVYMHVNKAPHGGWWDELAGENVTVVPMDKFQSVFQNEIKVIQHVADVAR